MALGLRIVYFLIYTVHRRLFVLMALYDAFGRFCARQHPPRTLTCSLFVFVIYLYLVSLLCFLLCGK